MIDNASNSFLAKSAFILVDVLEKIVAVALILYFSSKNIKYGVAVCVLCIVFFIVKSKLGERVEEGMAINIQGFNDNDDDDDDNDSDSDDEYYEHTDDTGVSRFSKLGSSLKTVEIVVARYNEDLEWLKHHPFNEFDVIIYNKGTNNNFYKPKKLKYIQNLENVGKCDHTYLYHIIQKYDNLCDITIFLPGSCNMETKIKKTKKMIYEIKHKNAAIFLYHSKMNNILTTIYNFYLDNWETSFLKNRTGDVNRELELSKIRPFGRWYEYHFPEIKLKYITYGGIFSISRRDVHNNSKLFYKNLLDELSGSANPEVGHYIERSWYSIFYPIKGTKFIKE
jgi:hypothetical protein